MMNSVSLYIIGGIAAIVVIALLYYFLRSRKISKTRKLPGGDKTVRATGKE